MKVTPQSPDSRPATFDEAARTYDEEFTYSNIGRLQRARVYHWLEKSGFFKSPKKIFEINCGTGYDADMFCSRGHSVVATDASGEMIAVAERIRNSSIIFIQQSFREALENQEFSDANAVFSNFGGLNCSSPEELNDFILDMAKKQRSDSIFAAVLMSQFCLMESLYFLVKRNIREILRRSRKGPVLVPVGTTFQSTYYHSPKAIGRMLKKHYTIQLIKPVAIFLPPSYLEPFFSSNTRLLTILNKAERIFGNAGPLAAWSDHYIIIAKRK